MEEKKTHVGDWLEKLQRESWNLELLVSGFSIFLLIQAYEGLVWGFRYMNLHTSLSGNLDAMIRTLLGIMLLASMILTFNLIAHVFLRGFWIGAVGLRSVQEKIDLDKLGYSEFFTKKLKERVPSLDRMLEKLDTLSSVIFSFTFLIVFMFFSVFLYFASLSLFAYLVNYGLSYLPEDSSVGNIIEVLAFIIVILILITGLLYAIDTLTLGFFKKYKWTSKIFFPIYKFMGWITMASIYRSIYYSLANRFSKKKIRLALITYLLLFFIVPFIKFDQYIFYPDNGYDVKVSSNEYDDLRIENGFIFNASIPSQIVEGSFLPLFIRYRVVDNKVLRKTCTEYVPIKKDGFNSGINIGVNGVSLNDAFINENNPENALKCFAEFYTIKIDSIPIESDFYFYIHPNQEERGVQTMLDINELPRGKHEIFVHRKKLNKDQELENVIHSHIVFWKE